MAAGEYRHMQWPTFDAWKEAEEKACAVASECVEPEAGGVEYEIGEIDPSAHGIWGHLYVTITGGQRYGNGEGCEAEFAFTGNITERKGRKSRMVLRVVLAYDGERAWLGTYESSGEYLSSIKDTIYIPSGGVLYFYLDVWVGGIKDKPIGLAFWVEEGEVVY
jgi:hypothetical protein